MTSHSTSRLPHRYLLTSLCVLVLSLCPLSVAALPLDSIFASAPRAALSLLDQTARLDLIDLYNGGLDARAENTLGGQAQLLHKSPSSLLLQLTPVSKWQLKLLPQGSSGDSLLVVVHTVEADGGGSILTAYDERWRPLSHFLFLRPSVGSYIVVPPGSLDVGRLRELETILSRQPVFVTFDEQAPLVRLSLSTDGLDRDTKSEVTPLLHAVTYRWDGAGFRPLGD